MSLPLHPRALQQLFQELLALDESSTPQVASLSLPRRLELFQQSYARALSLAKRGIRVEYQADGRDEQAAMKLSGDGAAIAIEWGATSGERTAQRCVAGTASIPLVSIQSIMLAPAPQSVGCFSLNVRHADDLKNAGDGHLRGVFRCLDGEPRVFLDWILAITCGANAFQQRAARSSQPPTRGKSAPSTVDLLWQGARLRIFELAEHSGLELAVAAVTDAISQFFDRYYRRHGALSGREAGGGALQVPPPASLFLQLATRSTPYDTN